MSLIQWLGVAALALAFGFFGWALCHAAALSDRAAADRRRR